MQRVTPNTNQLVINLCPCGSIHCTYGPVTLRLNRHEFHLFAEQVAQGVSFVKRQTEDLKIDYPSRPPHRTCH